MKSLITILSALLLVGIACAQECNSIASCVECLEADGCGTWQASDGTSSCQSSCLLQDDATCFSLNSNAFSGQSSPDVICSLAANAQADAELCSAIVDCGECVATTLVDTTKSCLWFADGEYCASACDASGCGADTCTDADETETATDSNSAALNELCKGLSCNFCMDLQCAWAPGVGCFPSCDAVDGNCFTVGEEYTTADICDAAENTEDTCNGLACDFCLGVGNCAWAPDEQECVSSCDTLATGRCFPSESFNATDVCAPAPTTSGGGEEETTESTETDSTGASTEKDDACMKLTSCEVCLDEKCDWGPDVGCIGNCSVFDTSCYPGEIYTAYEVCGGGASGGSTDKGTSTETSGAAAHLLGIVVVAVSFFATVVLY